MNPAITSTRDYILANYDFGAVVEIIRLGSGCTTVVSVLLFGERGGAGAAGTVASQLQQLVKQLPREFPMGR